MLACTHYPLLRNRIQDAVGKNIKLIDPAEIAVRQIGNYIKKIRSWTQNCQKISSLNFSFRRSGKIRRLRQSLAKGKH